MVVRDTRVQPVERTDTRRMVTPVMGSSITNVKHVAASLRLMPWTGALHLQTPPQHPGSSALLVIVLRVIQCAAHIHYVGEGTCFPHAIVSQAWTMLVRTAQPRPAAPLLRPRHT